MLPALSFLLTLGAFRALTGTGQPLAETLFTWAATAGFQVDAAFYFDQVTAVMCLVVTGIGTLIHVYSIGYMHGDAGYARYFAYLNLFLFFMLVLVLGKNMPDDVRRLGRRRPRLVPADRLLVPGPGEDRGGPQGLRRQPRR